MRFASLTSIVALALTGPAPERANFVHIQVRGEHARSVRAIWRPHAGVIGKSVADQQADVLKMHTVPNYADSARRWRDTTVRDTITTSLPADFVVDMGGGPVVIESVTQDSLEVEATLTRDGVRIRKRGTRFRIASNDNGLSVD